MDSYIIETFCRREKELPLFLLGWRKEGCFRWGPLDGGRGSRGMMLRQPGDAAPGGDGRGRCRPAGGAPGASSSRGNGSCKLSRTASKVSGARPPQPRLPVRGAARPSWDSSPGSRLAPRSRQEHPGGPSPRSRRGRGQSLQPPARPGPPGRLLRCEGRAGAGRRGSAANGRPRGEPARASRGPGSMSAGQSWLRAVADPAPAGPPCARAMPAGRRARPGSCGPRGPRR